ncbi:MAG: YqgE/AlgH family protein [Bacteroidetes bacterium]|nr:YqgE/AlgH family protein [Bacteroidota bacterium]MBS1630871.1 YqgE/AlgH family protein [Bacteroidota bacterium]
MKYDNQFPSSPRQTGLEPAPGRLLIAEPMLSDLIFSRTVVLLCEHGSDGSVGFMLNRKTQFTLNDLLPGIQAPLLPVYQGGPVQADTLHMLHRIPEMLEGKELVKGIFWGGNYDALKLSAVNNYIQPENIRLLMGYAGWGAGQLDKELEEGSWLVSEADVNLVFEMDASQLWRRAVESLGPDFTELTMLPINPQLN